MHGRGLCCSPPSTREAAIADLEDHTSKSRVSPGQLRKAVRKDSASREPLGRMTQRRLDAPGKI